PPTDFYTLSLHDALPIFSVASGVYFVLIAEDEVQRISLLFPLDTWHIVFGTILSLLTLELTRRTTGLGLTIVVLVFVAYNLFGQDRKSTRLNSSHVKISY